MNRRILLAGTFLAGLLAVAPAHAFPLAALAVASLGVTALGTTVATLTTLGTIVASTIGIGLEIGASLIVSAIFAPKAPKPSDVSGMVKQDIPSRQRHYGIRRVGGPLLSIDSKDGDLHMIMAHGQGEFDGYIEWYVDQRAAILDVDGWVSNGVYEGHHYVRIIPRVGTDDQLAIQELIDKLPDIWTAEHRCRGIAVSYLYANDVNAKRFNKIYPNRIPTWNAIARTAKVFDARDPYQIQTDKTTYAFRQDLPTQLADYLTNADGMQIPWEYINVERLTRAANVADQILTTKAGASVGRYHGGLSYTFDSDPKDVVSRFITAMDGRLSLVPDGTIAIDAGEWVSPTVTIFGGDIISAELRNTSGPLRESNEVVVKYTFAEAGYSETASDPWRDEENISQTGQTKRTLVESYEIDNHNHARRIAKIVAHRSTPDYQGTIVTNFAGLQAWDQRWIRIVGTPFDLDQSFEVMNITINPDEGTVSLEVVSFDASAYNFDALTEEGTAPSPPEELQETDVEYPMNVVAVASTQKVSGSTTVAVITLSWDEPDNEDLDVQAQISPAGEDTWLDIPANADDRRAKASNLTDGGSYDLRVRFLSSTGTAGTWATVEDVLATADDSAPATPLNLTSSVSAEIVTLDATAANDNTAYIVFRRGNVGDSFSAGTDISGHLRVTANQTATYDDEPGIGTWLYWAYSENGSAVKSATPAGPITVTVS